MLKKIFTKQTIFLIGIFLVTISLGIYFRIYPLREFSSDDASEKASVFIVSQLKKRADSQIERSYPLLPMDQKKKLSKQLFDKLIKSESKNIQEAIQNLSKKISKTDPHAHYAPYLLASDSFYYYDLTKNIQEHGKISSAIKGSKYLNTKMLAPNGHWEPLNLHAYVGYSIFKILHFFNPSITLMQGVSYTPLFIVLLSLIFYLSICTQLKCQKPFIFVGSIFFILAKIFVKRSAYGWYDNDPYNILFPFLNLFLFFGIIVNIQNFLNRPISSPSRKNFKKYSPIVFASAAMALYTFFWQGWVFFFSILLMSSICILLANHFLFKDKHLTKTTSIPFFMFFCLSFIFIGFSFGFSEFFTLFGEGWIALQNFLTPQLSAWPDLYISVGELKNMSLNEIINLCGGFLFFLISIIGLGTHLFLSLKTRDKTKFFQLTTISVFLLGSIFISMGAQRFALLCLVPISLTFPLGLETLYKGTLTLLRPYVPLRLSKPILWLLTCSLIFFPIKEINQEIPSLLNRIYNETWDAMMLKIKKETPKNSIITTWWPPGHFIKSMAERKVSFDGASINFPQAYWISNIFLSQSEEEALGLIRMLNGSANQSCEYLLGLGLPLSQSISLLKEITKYPKQKAQALLQTGLKNEKIIQTLLNLTHKTPPPSYLLIYNEFVDNNLQLFFIGNWNFKQIEKINSNPLAIKNVPSRKSSQYIEFLWSLAGGRPKYSGILSEVRKKEDKIVFQDNIHVNSKTKDCYIDSQKYGKGIPQSIFYADETSIKEKKLLNSNLPYSIIFFQENNQYHCALMDQFLAKSLLIKLYFFKGKGLKYFKPFAETSDLTQRTHIMTFEVDWNAYEKEND